MTMTMTMKSKTMNRILLLSTFLASPLSSVAYTVPKPIVDGKQTGKAAPDGLGSGNRRAFLSGVVANTAAAIAIDPSRALAADNDDSSRQEDVYFGVGCFWHVQHEFVSAERTLLGRKDAELTSMTGYAGGTKADGEGRVCYHNFQSIADYGKLGHGEVVGMRIPSSSIGDFAVEYFKLFGEDGERADPMDKGGEYR